MDKPVIVPQRQFDSLDEFISGQNNFYLHFVVVNDPAAVRLGIPDALINYRRERGYFKRLKDNYGGMERALTSLFTELDKTTPHDKVIDAKSTDMWAQIFLFESYKIMSGTVYSDEPGAIKPDGTVDDLFLTR